MDLDSTCRLCASKDGLKINLFDRNLGYVDKILKFVPLKISENDDLPAKICFRCAMMISEFENFCLNCIKVQENFLKNNQNGKESKSHQVAGPKSKKSNISDNCGDTESEYSDMDEKNYESDDSHRSAPVDSAECESNEEPKSGPLEKNKSHSNRRVSKKGFSNRTPSENEDSPMPRSLLDENKVPSHISKMVIPHPGLSQVIYTCEYCSQIFTSKSMAYSHVCSNLLNNCKRQEIVGPSNSYTCELCYQVFNRQAVLQAHRVGHMNNSSGEGSGDEIYDESACVFGQKRKKKRRGSRISRDDVGYKPFFEDTENE